MFRCRTARFGAVAHSKSGHGPATHFQEFVMKKHLLLACACLAASTFAQSVPADFSGVYVGAQVGHNHSESSGASRRDVNVAYPGLVVGHNTLSNGVVVGVLAFADFHKKSTTGNDGGVAFKVGKVWGDVMVFGQAGVVGRSPGYRPQWGVGAEYKVQKNLSVLALATQDRDKSDQTSYSNRNLSVGINYYFR